MPTKSAIAAKRTATAKKIGAEFIAGMKELLATRSLKKQVNTVVEDDKLMDCGELILSPANHGE